MVLGAQEASEVEISYQIDFQNQKSESVGPNYTEESLKMRSQEELIQINKEIGYQIQDLKRKISKIDQYDPKEQKIEKLHLYNETKDAA